MNINFYATLRKIIGQKTINLPVNGDVTVRELIDQVIALYPDLRAELLDDNGELLQRVHVLINGRDVPYLENQMNTRVTSRDTVNIFPAVGGG